MESGGGDEVKDSCELVGTCLGAEAAGNLVFQFRPTDSPFSGIVGKGNAPVPGKAEDVILEITETFKEAAKLAFASPSAFSGGFFWNRIGFHSFLDELIVSLKITFLFRKSVCLFHGQHGPALAHDLE